MRHAIHFGLLSGLVLSLLSAACGNGGSTGAGGGTTTQATSSNDASSSTGTGGTGGGGPTLYNGCDPAKAEDHTADATVEITFGGTVGVAYKPACIKVKSGTVVTWTGDTVTHPLDEGLIVNGAPVSDPNNPIKPTSNFQTSVSFTLAPAGTYGYFCDDHYGVGMKGAIFVQ